MLNGVRSFLSRLDLPVKLLNQLHISVVNHIRTLMVLRELDLSLEHTVLPGGVETWLLLRAFGSRHLRVGSAKDALVQTRTSCKASRHMHLFLLVLPIILESWRHLVELPYDLIRLLAYGLEGTLYLGLIQDLVDKRQLRRLKARIP